MTAPGEKSSTAGVVIAVVGALVLFAIPCLLLAAIFAPSYRRNPRAKQSECKTNLKAAVTGERALFGERDRYSESPLEVGFTPERGNRYVYLLRADGPVEDRSIAAPSLDATHIGFGVDSVRYYGADTEALRRALPPHVASQLGVRGTCPACDVTIACIGNIDDDPGLDVWSISTRARTAPTGAVIEANVPWNDVNDLP